MSNGWTPERRARQATLIHGWRPWEHSTGPRTSAGKGRSANNSFKGGLGMQVTAIAVLLAGFRRTGTTQYLDLIRADPRNADRYAAAVVTMDNVKAKRKQLGLE